MRFRCLLVSLLAVVPCRAAEPEWAQFLGPRRDGVSTETGLNVDWKTKPPPTVWKVALGSGYSSLAVRGDRLVTTVKRGERDMLVCLATADGKELWSHDVAPTYVDFQKQGKGPRGTPTIVGERVYALFGAGELVCVNLADGKRVWLTNILEATKATPRGDMYYWGLSQSPLVEGEAVIVQPGGKDSSVAAFHRDTGKLLWGAGSDPIGYGSPIAIDAAGRRQIVCPTGQSILGVDPKSGKLLWRYEFGNRFDATGATPVWDGKRLFVSAAYGVGSAVVELAADGDKVTVQEKWKNKNLQTLMATAIVSGDVVYGFHGDLARFGFRCLDLNTGETKWSVNYGSRVAFIAAQGHLIAISERGDLMLIEATPEKMTMKAELPGVMAYKAWAMPALANKRLYLRDEKNVVCIDLAK
jgi:outer membrane protein assembly factor BamB